MTTHPVATVLGRVLADRDGLQLALLPVGVPRELVLGVARSANLRRAALPDGTPYSLVVSTTPADTGADGDVTCISSRQAAQFRQGNRLVVAVHGAFREIATLTSAFPIALRPSFPSGEAASGAGALTLRDLAAEAASWAWTEARGHDGPEAAIRSLTDGLHSALSFLAQSYEHLGNRQMPWPTLWWNHVDRALTTLIAMIRAEPDSNSAHDAGELAFAALGLPSPHGDTRGRWSYAQSATPQLYCRIIEQSWSRADEAQAAVATLAAGRQGNTHPLDCLDWGQSYDESVREHGNPIIGLCLHGDRETDLRRAAAWRDTNGLEFFGLNTGGPQHSIRLLLQGVPLPVIGDGKQAILPTDHFSLSFDSEPPCLILSGVEAHIPCRRDVNGAIIALGARSMIGLAGTPADCVSFITQSRTVHNNTLVLHGSMVVRLVLSQPWPLNTLQLSVDVPQHDPALGVIDRKATVRLVVPHPVAGMLVAEELAGSRSDTPIKPVFAPAPGFAIAGRSIALCDDSGAATGPAVKSVDGSGRLRFTAYSPRSQSELRVSGTKGVPRDDRDWPQLHIVDQAEAADGAIASLGILQCEVSVEVSGYRPFLPLAATALRVAPTDDPPPSWVAASLQGRLEQLYCDHALDPQIGPLAHSMRSTLGHVLLPTDVSSCGLDTPEVRGGLIVPPERELKPDRIPDFLRSGLVDAVSQDVIDDFWSAFDGLGLPTYLDREIEPGSTRRYWLSQSSLINLADSTALNDYLRAYSRLMRAAEQSGKPHAAALAAVPFSTLLLRTRNDRRVLGTLVSPYHPIRLAWLAGAEAAVARLTETNHRLLQLLEGWAFPAIVRKINDIGQGYACAIPIDNGHEQMFLGWSYLAAADSDEGRCIQVPDRAGRFAMPGSSTSGLNEGGVAAALRDFSRVHPHVTTLTIDLAALQTGPRSHELDAALIREITKIHGATGDSSSLPGGVRVKDSIARAGDPRAREELMRSVGVSQSSLPIGWERYDPESQDAVHAHLRIVQDSGAKVSVTGASPGRGVAGRIPLRRFVVRESGQHDKGVRLSPVIDDPDAEWPEFVEALGLAEAGGSSGSAPVINARIEDSALIGSNAAWTVIGDMHLDPQSTARLLASHGAERPLQLWEWRPPLFEASRKEDIPQFERRPYLTIARVSNAFRRSLVARVEKLRAGPAANVVADQIIASLGERGIGLASLLAMGHRHATGALGFYAAYKLLDRVTSGDGSHAGGWCSILPLDAVDRFLTAMAGADFDAQSDRRRADLLLLGFDEHGEALTLVPIELKFYGLEKHPATGGFPASDSPLITEPTEQLSATHRQLAQVCDRYSQASHADSRDELLLNAMTAVLEASFLVSDTRTSAQLRTHVLRNAVYGTLRVRVGRGLLMFFQVGGAGSGPACRVERILDAGQHCLHARVLIDPSAVANEIWGDATGNTSAQCTNAVQWCLDRSSDVSAGPATEPAGSRSVTRSPGGTPELSPLPAAGVKRDPSSETSTPMPGGQSRNIEANSDNWADTATTEAAASLGDGVRVLVGTRLSTIGDSYAEFWPSNTRLNQLNIGVVGDLGTGKTQLLKALIKQLRSARNSNRGEAIKFLILDYKKDYINKDFLEDVGGYVLDPRAIPLNFFDLRGCEAANPMFERARMFVDIIRKIYSGVGPVQVARLQDAIMACLRRSPATGATTTIYDVANEYANSVTAVDSVSGILSSFVHSEMFEPDPSKLKTFDEMFDGVVVVNLGALGGDQLGKNALVIVFLNLFYEYMLRSKKRPFVGSDPQLRFVNSYLLVDEAKNILSYDFPVLEQLLLQGREFGFGVILASQYLSHFMAGSGNYREPLLSWFIHKVPDVKKAELAALGLDRIEESTLARIRSLEPHCCLYKSLGINGEFIRGIPYYELIKHR